MLRTATCAGTSRTVEFEFDLLVDTATNVAAEMVSLQAGAAVASVVPLHFAAVSSATTCWQEQLQQTAARLCM